MWRTPSTSPTSITVWKSTRRRVDAIQDERAVNLISTQVAGLLGNADVNDDGLTTLAELDDFLRDTYRAVWKSTSASGHALAPSSGEEPTSPRHRAGVASMAWRSTRRSRTNAP